MTCFSPFCLSIRRPFMIAVTLVAIGGGAWNALAQTDPHAPLAATAGETSRDMKLELNKSRLIDLPDDVAEVVISNPAVVEAVVRTSRRVHLLGQQVGQTSAVFIGRDGIRLLTLDIAVERDLTPVATLIRRLVPTANVRLEAVNDNIVLSGTAPSPLEAARVADIAGRFTAKRDQVLNMLNVEAKEQVLLRVTVAEMNRSVIKRLGVDLREAFISGNITIAKIAANSFPVTGGVAGGALLDSVAGLVRAAPSGTTARACPASATSPCSARCSAATTSSARRRRWW
jgi:pilus assembly protein CpaC